MVGGKVNAVLVSALIATLVGFGLLVVALVTGTLWLAIACIVVCVLGALLLVADILGLGPTLARPWRRLQGPRLAGRRARRAPAVAGDEPDAEITTEMPRVVDEPVPDLSADHPEWSGRPTEADRHALSTDARVAAAYAAAHHGRHESPDDKPVDNHAHVLRDTDPPATTPWLTPTTPRRHTRHAGDDPESAAVESGPDADATAPHRHRHAAD